MTDKENAGKSYDNLIEEILKSGRPYSQGFDLKHTLRCYQFTIERDLNEDEQMELDEMTSSMENTLTIQNIIVPTGHHQWKYFLTQKGRAILETGGWIAYQEQEVKRQEKEIKKLDFDLTISEFQARFKLLPFILSFIAITISGYKTIQDIWKSDDQIKLERRLDGLEIVTGKLTYS